MRKLRFRDPDTQRECRFHLFGVAQSGLSRRGLQRARVCRAVAAVGRVRPLCERATDSRAYAIWILAAGLMVGCGIWATHFIAMLAYEPGVDLAYDIALTALSLILAMLITGR